MEAIREPSETLSLAVSSGSRSVLEGILSHPLATAVLSLATLMTAIYYAAVPKPLPGIPYTLQSPWNPFGDALRSPIFQVFLGPFRKPIVVVADIQELIDISSRRTKEFDRGGFLTEWVGILFPEGTISMPSHDKFKQQRNTWAVTMASQFLNTVSASTIHRHTGNLVRLWATKVRLANGRPVEVSDDIKQVTFDMAAYVAESHDLPDIVHACHILVEHLKNMRGSVWLSATKLWISFLPSWKEAWRVKESAMMRLIENSRGKFASSGRDTTQREVRCAMDEIFQREARAEAKGWQTSHREMIDETFAYIVGGHETTQDTTKWSLKYLTAYQDQQNKLREALLELFPGANANNLPSHEEMVNSEHPFVEASIQELIRIALTAPSWTRRTTREVTVLGYRIPPGIDIFGAPSVQSLEDMDDFEIDPQLRSPSSRPRTTGKWDRTTKGVYQPERWIDAQGNYDAYAGPMLPFGAGPRGCFARLELRMMIIMLVLSFEFKPIPDRYASFRAEEVINRGPAITYIRPVLRI
ncbi:cytochrome P450 [Aspergillus homomorphus CBS 101889]|uniref:Cytochrome P450 n=1 Tax=Aspergillus homomorphus (strain CBS 101889) TaxID=1450537 RepID=A0A395HRU9_ASPHC|nr:cytochrome P450 [Aspergillus homomorphus CBS 101889]RAL09578.1 cytochrome P450 [Aspergillus homomorphus CBS 101889]